MSSAIIGASRPEQVEENAVAAEIRLDEEALQAIEEAVGRVVQR